MNPNVINVTPLLNYTLELEFDNGDTRLFDVSPFLDRGVFSELKKITYFKRVSVAFGGVEWPNGQDFSKDTLYRLSVPMEAFSE